MSIKRYNISKPEQYEAGGEQKTKWHNIGEVVMFEDKGRGLIKIPAIGLEAQVFPWKGKDEQGGGSVNDYQKKVDEIRSTDASPDDIPF